MFNRNAEFVVKIRSGGEKTCVLRWPTDEEWCARSRAQKTVRRQIGRGQSITDVPAANRSTMELFERIRKDTDGTEFDEVEAAAAVEKLERCTVTFVERDGDRYTIKMVATQKRIETVHVLREPSQRAVLDYGRAAVKRSDGRRETITSVSLEPGGELYDRMVISVSGYADPAPAAVPIIHKDIVLVEVLSAMEALDDDDPEA